MSTTAPVRARTQHAWSPFFLATSFAIIAAAAIGIRAASPPKLLVHIRRVTYAAPIKHVVAKPLAKRPTTNRPPVRPIVTTTSTLNRAQATKIVLDVAHQLVGRPYRYGASGPNAFDCSGFTSFVWHAAGVSLPHNAAAQFSAVPRVPVKALQPGDLVFSGNRRVSHAGLYIGNGLMINAPESGRRVQVERLRTNLIGAGRPALLLRNA